MTEERTDREVIMEGELRMDEVYNELDVFDPEDMTLIENLEGEDDDLYREILCLRSMILSLERKVAENKQKIFDHLKSRHEQLETQPNRLRITMICRIAKENRLVAAEVDLPKAQMLKAIKRFFGKS